MTLIPPATSQTRAEACRLRDELTSQASVTIGETTIPLSEPLREALRLLLEEIATGHDVEVTRSEPYLTTSQAADLLHVSRPTLVKLLDDGLIDYEQPGVHRRIPRTAIDRFLQDTTRRRRTHLAEFAATENDQDDAVVTTR